jgi:demethylmenaquinone methyltransferase/2-methoxy-6-polyprenyl-1,4-benzoquinol methylase
MFDAVAERYDLLNAVMTFGQERRWRRIAAQAVAPGPGMRILDLAAGTAASSVPLAAAGATVVACDFSVGMLTVGRRQRGAGPGGRLRYVAGDGQRLPFSDGCFDAVTVSFGLRNVARLPLVLAELIRVTRPGGRLVVLETSRPTVAALRSGHAVYVTRVLPRLARALASNPAAYAYLAESVGDWLDQEALADQLRATGWSGVGWRNLLFGAVALHCARRPD